MKPFLGILLITLLLFTFVCGYNKKYRSCFRHKCQSNKNCRRCCRIGAKVANEGYDCTVDTIIATQRYKLSFQQKSHSRSSLKSSAFFAKVKKCKPHDACLECCCKHRRKRILHPPIDD